MSEILLDISSYESELRERSSVLAGFAMTAAYHAAAADFCDAVLEGADRVNTSEEWWDGDPITEDESIAIASSSVLMQMAAAFDNGRHLKLEPWVEDQMQVYQRALNVIRKVGLFFSIDLIDPELSKATAGALWGKVKAPNRAAQIATKVWEERGDVPLTRDVFRVLPAVRDMNIADVPKDVVRVPFYQTLCEPLHGTWWLDSLLTDLEIIDERAGPIGHHLPGER